MIGRGALGAPWIFRGAPLDATERAAIIRRHAALIEAHLPERLALVQLKKHLAWYFVRAARLGRAPPAPLRGGVGGRRSSAVLGAVDRVTPALVRGFSSW